MEKLAPGSGELAAADAASTLAVALAVPAGGTPLRVYLRQPRILAAYVGLGKKELPGRGVARAQNVALVALHRLHVVMRPVAGDAPPRPEAPPPPTVVLRRKRAAPRASSSHSAAVMKSSWV